MEKVKNVAAYIANALDEAKPIMEELRKIITDTVPQADEGISWNVPIYKYHGILVGFDVAKYHVSFGVDSLQEEDRKILKEKGYKTGKKTIQIKFDQEVPSEVIKKLILAQAEINELNSKG
ncbi:DUF1801 domain-containing protein [Echinicola soli]|uniref:DUF1801 domain-containing protein n=1 Tax=Echinicola soli TaxID=2591634 RepID=A0A514CFN7_9BACT|nr:DUF1801 domain-containing protein [Echinicola soli]QDH78632.1 DUF1801 domain-containing protein [Echinicola soli]